MDKPRSNVVYNNIHPAGTVNEHTQTTLSSTRPRHPSFDATRTESGEESWHPSKPPDQQQQQLPRVKSRRNFLAHYFRRSTSGSITTKRSEKAPSASVETDRNADGLQDTENDFQGTIGSEIELAAKNLREGVIFEQSMDDLSQSRRSSTTAAPGYLDGCAPPPPFPTCPEETRFHHTTNVEGPLRNGEERCQMEASGSDRVDRISFLTFNVGLLEYRWSGVSLYSNPPFTWRRLEHMPVALRAVNADVIAIQELYDLGQAAFLEKALRLIYPYCAQCPSGGMVSVTNGLMVLSKFPVLRVNFHPFKEVTLLESMFGSKGVLEVAIEIPSIGKFAILNCHLASGAVDPESDAVDIVRLLETNEMLAIAHDAYHIRGEIPLIIGDLNSGPDVCSGSYRRLRMSGWEDAFALARRKHADEKQLKQGDCLSDPPGKLNVMSPQIEERSENGVHAIKESHEDLIDIMTASTVIPGTVSESIPTLESSVPVLTALGGHTASPSTKSGNNPSLEQPLDYSEFMLKRPLLNNAPLIESCQEEQSVSRGRGHQRRRREEGNEAAYEALVTSSSSSSLSSSKRTSKTNDRKSFHQENNTTASSSSSQETVLPLSLCEAPVAVIHDAESDAVDLMVDNTATRKTAAVKRNKRRASVDLRGHNRLQYEITRWTKPIDYTWDPRNPLNMLGPHSGCHGLRCDHIFVPPSCMMGPFAEFYASEGRILFQEPRVLVDTGQPISSACSALLCYAWAGPGRARRSLLVTLSDHHAVLVEFVRFPLRNRAIP